MRVFLDANILFAAAWSPAGRVGAVIEFGLPPPICLLTSTYAENEARRNLERKRPAALPALQAVLARCEIVAHVDDEPCPAAIPPKERPILAAAIVGRADVLLTGDIGDFGGLLDQPRATGGVTILTVSRLLKLVP